MRILHVHNFYQRPGGEDQAFATENALVEAHGHHLVRYSVHNDRVADMGRLRLAAATVWSGTTYRELRALIRAERPEVAAFQNTLPLVSPSAYYAARAEGVPVVQTLQNYRLLCANGYLFRDGRVCEGCVGRSVPWPAVVHACYRESRAATGVVAAMLVAHRAIGTYRRMVDLYVALTEFERRKLVEAGLPPDRIAVKPHFVDPDPGPGAGRGGYALFVGRLSPEKGLETLIAAWERLGRAIPLRVAGDGPVAPLVAAAARRNPAVEWVGHQPVARVSALMADAAFLVVPSLWYETFGRVSIEAFARGTPVVASAIGAVAEVVAHGRTGRLFRPGDADSLATEVAWLLDHPAELASMREATRREYEARYTAARNYEILMDLYRRAIGTAREAA